MRAVWLPRHGDSSVLEWVHRPLPKVGPKDVLVEVRASSINPRDSLIRAGKYPFQPMIRLPMIPGSDVAGTVVERGSRVRSLALGQPVYGMQPSIRGFGAHAEFVAVPAQALAAKPVNMSFGEAAGVPLAGLTAYQALVHRLRLRRGQRLLILGASGGVGTYAVQIARILEAQVTAVCSGRNRRLVESLGAHRVLDYQTTDVLDAATLESGQPYDAVFDVVGRSSLAECRAVLGPGGAYVTTIPRRRQLLAWLTSTVARGFGGRTGRTSVVMVRSVGEQLRRLGDWIEEGRLRTVVEDIMPMADIARAHDAIRSQRTRGKLILSISSIDDGEASSTVRM